MRKFFLLSAILLSISVSSFAADDRYSFVPFSDPSVFHSPVTCVHRAKAGFYWAGMPDGLARFDNGRWVLYSADSAAEGSLPSSDILAIGSDNSGNTWIATGSGLVRYRPERDDFESSGISASSILAVGEICYFGSVDTLFAYDSKSSAFSVAAVLNTHSSYRINSMSSLPDGRVLLSSAGGAPMVFDPSLSRILPVPVDMPGTFLAWADSRGRIWRSVAGSGVECYSPSLSLLFDFTPSGSGLSSPTVLCFCERDGKIWMGTEGGGISIFDPDTHEFSALKHIVADRESFPSRTITSMCLDKSSNDILCGRSRGGLLFVSRSQLTCYDVASPGQTFFAPEGINCLYQGNDPDRIWIGTNGSGIFQYNLPDRKFIYYYHGDMGLNVRSMAGLSADQILMSCGSDGFKVFNIRHESVSSFHFGEACLDSAPTDTGFELSNTPDGCIHIASSDAMFKYDIRSRSVIRITLPSEAAGNGPIRAAAGAVAGKYYYNGRYLFNYDSSTESLRMLMDAGSSSSITAVSLDQNDRLWVASDKGLCCFNVWSGSYECLESGSGRDASTILCDVMGRVWLGGPFGLHVFNTSSRSLYVLDETDGMSAFDPDADSRLLSLSGDLFFGGSRHLVRVDRNFSFPSCDDPSVGLSSFSVDGERFFNTSGVRLGPKASVLNLKAYAIDDFMLRHKRFRFMVQRSSSPDEVFDSENGDFQYHIPGAGAYSISASCSTCNAGWTEWKELSSFRVPSGLSGSIWEFFALFILLAATVYSMVSLRKEKNKHHGAAELTGRFPDSVEPARQQDVIRQIRPVASVHNPVDADDSQSQPEVFPVTDLSQASMLVVEDDPELQDYLKAELGDSVKFLYQAYNGLEAVKLLENKSVDIIISDVMMPQMDGFALCRYVKTTVTVSHIPIILLTARSDEKSRIIGYKNGADDYITKPFDLAVLKDSINNLFMNRQGIRTKFAQGEASPVVEEVTFSSADEQFMRKFNGLIGENIENPELDVAFIVDAMGLSRTVIFNKIKLLTGLNIQNYINKMRMEHVIHLMKTTNLSLGEIADRSGFSSPRYFSTSFKNFTGKTPSLYKKELSQS